MQHRFPIDTRVPIDLHNSFCSVPTEHHSFVIYLLDNYATLLQGCITTAAEVLQMMNSKVNPCEDFYRYEKKCKKLKFNFRRTL